MPRLWIGRTKVGIAIILAYRKRGEWTHAKRVLWYS